MRVSAMLWVSLVAIAIASSCRYTVRRPVPSAVYGDFTVGHTEEVVPGSTRIVDPTPFPSASGRMVIAAAPGSDPFATPRLIQALEDLLRAPDLDAPARCHRAQCFLVVAAGSSAVEHVLTISVSIEGPTARVSAEVRAPDAVPIAPPIWAMQIGPIDPARAADALVSQLLPPARSQPGPERVVRHPVKRRMIVDTELRPATVIDRR